MNSNQISRFNRLGATLAAVSLVAGLGQASADSFSGTTTGTFVNPVAGPDNPSPVTTGVGTSHFTWGSGSPNSLTYTGTAFTSPSETSFKVGSVNYNNGVTSLGSNVDGVGLDVHVAFTAPSGLNVSFDFPLSITTTPNNTGTQLGDADYITLPSASSTTFTSGLNTYTLKLSFAQFKGTTGETSADGTIFYVYEGGSASAELDGIITTDLRGVPDNGSTLALFGLGLAGVVAARRRK